MSYGTNAPNGFQPVKKLDGSAWTGATNPYQIANTYGTALFRGDPVTVDATSGCLVVGVAGSACVGVFWGVKYTDSTGVVKFMNYWPGNPGVLTGSTVEALVIDDPDTVFSAQETSGTGTPGTPLALADRGLNINFLYTAGSTATGTSAVSLNNAVKGTDSTYNCKILQLDPTPGNAVGAFANWLVVLNNHLYKGGVTGV
jgi:hypothetical protein